MFNPQKIKQDFPAFAARPEMVYLDNAATTHKPKKVLDSLREFYIKYNTNTGKGFCSIAREGTKIFESSRIKIAEFLNADPIGCIFFRGTTDAINFVAHSLSQNIGDKTNVVITELEHHSNFLPWLDLCKKNDLELRVIKIKNSSGELDQSDIESMIDSSTLLVSVTMVSNVLGIKTPFENIFSKAKNEGALTLLDAAQGITNFKISFNTSQIDFLAFSGHKIFAPTGIGVLCSKKETLSILSPMLLGGGMVKTVNNESVTYLEPPYCFEAGTQDAAAVYALSVALDYHSTIDHELLNAHKNELMNFAATNLNKIDSLNILGPKEPEKRNGILSFSINGVHPHDIAEYLAKDNICVRAGLHCASPLHSSLNVPSTTRISVQAYNTVSDIQKFLDSIKDAFKYLKK